MATNVASRSRFKNLHSVARDNNFCAIVLSYKIIYETSKVAIE